MTKTTSCGVIIRTEHEILLCHVTHQSHWDIPKGGSEMGETPVQTAVRECREESGIEFYEDELKDLGLFKYNSQKNLHLFEYSKEKLNPMMMKCESYFPHRVTGELFPETDKFEYFSFEMALTKVCGSLRKVLRQYFESQALL